MKKYLAALLAFLVPVAAVVPAFAAEPYDAEWVPPVPSVLEVSDDGNSYSLSSLVFSGSDEAKEFAFNFSQEGPWLILIDQGVYNKYKESKDIDYDRQFSLYFIKPDKKPNGEYYDLGYFQHNGGPRHQEQMNVPSPMRYGCYEPHSFVKFIYDENTSRFYMQPNISRLPGGAGSIIRFTYVLDSNTLCSPSDVYPYYSAMYKGRSGVVPSGSRDISDFEVSTIYHQVVDGKAVEHWRDYDWWLGIEGGEVPPYNENLDIDQDTNGDGKPDINVDVDGDGQPDINIDTDGDGLPDVNIDTDGDGKPDINIDTNGDGKPDINIDTDGDRIPDLNVDINGDKKPDLNVDTNGDGKPDINIDTNGNKKPDLNIDTDGDGKPDINVDTNGDKKPDLNIDTNGDGKPDENVDIDGDGKPDVNVKPGGGSSSGGSSGSGGGSSGSGGGGSEGEGPGSGGGGSEGEGPGSGGGSSSDKGSGHPDTWFDDTDDDLDYDPWQFFDPFQSDKTPITWDKDYDPTKPGDQIYSGYDPFAVFDNLLKDMFGG